MYTIMINSSYEIGYDILVVDNYNQKILVGNETWTYTSKDEIKKILERILKIIEENEEQNES